MDDDSSALAREEEVSAASRNQVADTMRYGLTGQHDARHI